LGLDERLRQDYREQQFRSAITDTTIVPRSMLDSFIRLSQQSREVSVVNFAPDQYLSRVKITPEQVKAYYEAHPIEFTIPEQVRVEYVELSLDAAAARATVPAEEVKKQYEAEVAAGKHGTREERRASHILIPAAADAKDDVKKAAEAKANAIAEAVRKNPKSFAEVAKKESQDPGSAAQGGDLGFFARNGTMVKPFEDAVFEAKKDEIVGPVKSDFGYHIIRVTDVKPAKIRSLQEAAPEIEANLKKAKAQQGFADAVEQMNNIVYEQSSSLKPASEKLGLALQTSQWFPKGGAPVPALGNPKLQAEIFSDSSIKGKRNTTAIEVAANTFVAAHVIDHKPAELRPLDSVKAEIEKRLTRDEALRMAREEGEAKLKELQAGKDAGLKWPAPLVVSRQKPGGLFGPVLDKVFRADAKKLPAYVGVENPAGYSVVQISKVIELDKIDEQQRQALAARLRQAVADEELQSALTSVREHVGVAVKKGALDVKRDSDQPQQAPAPQPRGKF
jgi:peptidyl-prolyl cis-trans isomerase D